MAAPERQTIQNIPLKNLNPDEARQLIASHQNNPAIEIVCIRTHFDGKVSTVTRVPFLHKKHGLNKQLNTNLFFDMVKADTVIIRERASR